MGNRIVSVALDDKTWQIWNTIEGSKSKWVRRMLNHYALEQGVKFIDHLGQPHVTWGLWENDARCNPSSGCLVCWNMQQITFYKKSTARQQFVPKKDLMLALAWRERDQD